MELNYKKMTMDDLMDWCEEHNELEWLIKTAETEVPKKVYPKIINEEGKEVEDKKAIPTIEMHPISAMGIKIEFCKKFMPDLLPTPKAPKKALTFREKLALRYKAYTDAKNN